MMVHVAPVEDGDDDGGVVMMGVIMQTVVVGAKKPTHIIPVLKNKNRELGS